MSFRLNDIENENIVQLICEQTRHIYADLNKTVDECKPAGDITAKLLIRLQSNIFFKLTIKEHKLLYLQVNRDQDKIPLDLIYSFKTVKIWCKLDDFQQSNKGHNNLLSKT